MGSIEGDSEPPSKQAKPNPAEETVSSSMGDQMPQDLPAQGHGKVMIGTKRVINKQEFVRVMLRALDSLGYVGSREFLEKESKIPMHSPAVRDFLKQVSDRKWDESVETLHGLGFSNDVVTSAEHVILEQMLLEILEKDEHLDKHMDVWNTLQDIARLDPKAKVPEVAYHLIFYGKTKPVCSPAEAVEKLEKLIPSPDIIPSGRLEHLVEQALDIQRDSCVCHNTLQEFSLYIDHQCGKEMTPSHTLQFHYCRATWEKRNQ